MGRKGLVWKANHHILPLLRERCLDERNTNACSSYGMPGLSGHIRRLNACPGLVPACTLPVEVGLMAEGVPCELVGIGVILRLIGCRPEPDEKVLESSRSAALAHDIPKPGCLIFRNVAIDDSSGKTLRPLQVMR